jgi:hypothetical protein
VDVARDRCSADRLLQMERPYGALIIVLRVIVRLATLDQARMIDERATSEPYPVVEVADTAGRVVGIVRFELNTPTAENMSKVGTAPGCPTCW